MLGNDKGDPNNITDKTFEEAAHAARLTIEVARKNIMNSLNGKPKK
jgi:hypothetical protein